MAAGLKLYNLDRVDLISGQAVQIIANSFPSFSIIITAESTNSGNIYIGDSTVDANKGIPIEPGNTLAIDSPPESRWSELDISDIYIYTSSSGNKARISCLRRRN